jgi:hypothetical protein
VPWHKDRAWFDNRVSLCGLHSDMSAAAKFFHEVPLLAG